MLLNKEISPKTEKTKVKIRMKDTRMQKHEVSAHERKERESVCVYCNK